MRGVDADRLRQGARVLCGHVASLWKPSHVKPGSRGHGKACLGEALCKEREPAVSQGDTLYMFGAIAQLCLSVADGLCR